MKFLALVSGGKDSVYSIKCCIDDGHELVGVLHMRSNLSYEDSYMYQTVGSEVIKCYESCFRVPVFTYTTSCNALNIDLEYTALPSDEVEDLFGAIKDIKSKIMFEGVCSGAILSRYQKNRVENICNRLNLQSLAPLWGRNQKELLKEMIENKINAILVKVASSSLSKDFLGENISKVYNSNVLLDGNYCGEGGEYESIVLDCPLFKSIIVYDSIEIKNHPDEQEGSGSVFYVEFKNVKTVEK